jgi:hypothetical protein
MGSNRTSADTWHMSTTYSICNQMCVVITSLKNLGAGHVSCGDVSDTSVSHVMPRVQW